jgi:hypothetical protein
VKQIRIERLRAGREHPGREVLPRGARDPDVVRAKALACRRRPRRAGKPLAPGITSTSVP